MKSGDDSYSEVRDVCASWLATARETTDLGRLLDIWDDVFDARVDCIFAGSPEYFAAAGPVFARTTDEIRRMIIDRLIAEGEPFAHRGYEYWTRDGRVCSRMIRGLGNHG